MFSYLKLLYTFLTETNKICKYIYIYILKENYIAKLHITLNNVMRIVYVKNI